MRTRKIPPRCMCGCGRRVPAIFGRGYARFNMYLPGHSHANKGVPKSPTHRAKCRRAHLGRCDSPATKEKKRIAATGRRQSIGERQKKRESHLGRFCGEEASNWQGGLSFLPYNKGWTRRLRQEIRQRDNHHCQNPFCISHSTYFQVHHIDYDKENNSKENLILLCGRCHGKTSASNRGYWEKYYRLIQCLRFCHDETSLLKKRVIWRGNSSKI